jgi:hypothetical protein
MLSLSTLVWITDLLTPLTVFSVWLTLRRADSTSFSPRLLAVPLLLVLLWGALWTWWPTLAAMRFAPPPFSQAGAILSVIVSLNLLRFIPRVRQMFQTINVQRLVDLGVWRVVYGSILLLIGLQNGLPPEFFWSAAAGDIFVGLWAITIIFQRPNVSLREILAWNVVGLLDLLHVLFLGVLYLANFYASHPDVPVLNLLPLVGVPLLLVLHIYTLVSQRRSYASQRA